MNHWTFITIAYGVTLTTVAVMLIASWRAMRTAERAAEQMRNDA